MWTDFRVDLERPNQGSYSLNKHAPTALLRPGGRGVGGGDVSPVSLLRQLEVLDGVSLGPRTVGPSVPLRRSGSVSDRHLVTAVRISPPVSHRVTLAPRGPGPTLLRTGPDGRARWLTHSRGRRVLVLSP